ncbi:hypothetical protein OG203_30975 [Nocardia sp. NBC_01499]|uniref:hypothetical protein n=1 Tax=Nocardia sp. NBC_01499 TaxID=2903597 RepID=UPI00386D2106
MPAQQHPRRRSPHSTTDRDDPRPHKAIPSTIWACGTEPIHPVSAWPTPIITRVITEFSTSSDQVLLWQWPRLPHEDTGRDDPDITTALAEVQGSGRTVQILELGAEGRISFAPGSADLIITIQIPGHHDLSSGADLLAFAATRLRAGGVLVVLTCCDWTHGVLNDPTAAIVADAQAADLLYLQHVVAVAIRGDAIATGPTTPSAEFTLRRAHRRVHTDVLVFVQPNDHHPLPEPKPCRPRP